MRNKKIICIIAIIAAIYMFSIIFPRVSSYKYYEQLENAKNLSPSIDHLFGTDYLGRDLFVRVQMGVQITITIAIFSIIISILIGIPYGIIAGYFEGRTEHILTSIMDVIESIPRILYAMLFMTVFNGLASGSKEDTNVFGNIIGLLITIALIFWIPIARVIKGEVKKIKNTEYVEYARTKNACFRHIVMKHLIPNSIQLIVTLIIQNLPAIISIEAFLSFVGIGIQPPMPSLGKIINYGISGMRSYPHELIIPIVVLCLIIMLFSLLGTEYIKVCRKE